MTLKHPFTAVRVQARKVTATYPPKIWGDPGITREKDWEPEVLADTLLGGGQGRLRTCKSRIGCPAHRSAPCAISCGAARAAWVWVLRPPLPPLVPSISPPSVPTAGDRRGAGDAGLPHQRLWPRGPGRDGRTGVPPAATPGAPAVPPTPAPITDLDPDTHSVTALARGGGDTGGGPGAAALAPGC